MDANIKCVVVGDGAVGKTILLIAFSSNSFPEDYVPTVFDNYTANVKFSGKMVALGLWDTAGQEDYDKLRPLSYPDTDVFMCCYSVMNPNSYDNIEGKWVPEVLCHCPDTPIILCATKIDLRNDPNSLSRLKEREQEPMNKKQGEEMKNRVEAVGFRECSAKTQEGLKELFELVIETVLKPDTATGNIVKKKKLCIVL